jgi:hypothetical protein
MITKHGERQPDPQPRSDTGSAQLRSDSLKTDGVEDPWNPWRADYVHRGHWAVKARRFYRTVSTARRAGIMASGVLTTLPVVLIFMLIQPVLVQGVTPGGLNS